MTVKRKQDMAPKGGVVVRRIHLVGATEHGEHIGIELETTTTESFVLLIPFGLYQKLLLALLTAGGIAHKEQLEKLGSSKNIMEISGFSSFHPTDFEVGRGRRPIKNDSDVVILRLKSGTLPVIDITATFHDAARMGAELMEAVKSGPTLRSKSH